MTKRLLCGLAVAVLAFSAPAGAGLIAHWDLDEGSGTAITDTSGSTNQHNGDFVGGQDPAWLSTANARLGDSGLGFTATATNNGDRVDVSHHAELNLPNGAFTLSFWYKADNNGDSGIDWPGPFYKGGGNNGWIVFRANANDRMRFKSRNNQPTVWTTNVDETWTHYVLAFDGTDANVFYTDGTGATQTNNWGSDITAGGALQFGKADQYGTQDLDDIGIWDEQLGTGEARSIYTVPQDLALDYDIADVSDLWDIHTTGTGASGDVEGTTWYYTDALPDSPAEGDAYTSGGGMYVALTATTGVTTVPEPTTLALAAIGLLGLRRRRRE